MGNNEDGYGLQDKMPGLQSSGYAPQTQVREKCEKDNKVKFKQRAVMKRPKEYRLFLLFEFFSAFLEIIDLCIHLNSYNYYKRLIGCSKVKKKAVFLRCF